MTPTQIGILIIAGVAAVIVFSLVMQGIENQRRERKLRILTLKDQIRRAEHLLHALPDELKTPHEERLLIKYLIKHWQELGQLDATSSAQQQIGQLTEMAKSGSKGPRAANGLTLFPSREQATSAKAIMRELAQFLEDLQKAGRISTQALQPVLNQVRIAHARAALDIELFNTREVEQNRGPLVAVHQYRSCERTITKLSKFAPMDAQKQIIDSLIMDLDVRIEAEREAREAERAAEAEQKNGNKRRTASSDPE